MSSAVPPAHSYATWRRRFQHKATTQGLSPLREALIGTFDKGVDDADTLQRAKRWLMNMDCRDGEDFEIKLPCGTYQAQIIITNPQKIKWILGHVSALADSVAEHGDDDIGYRRGLETGRWQIASIGNHAGITGSFSDEARFQQAMQYLSAKNYLAKTPFPASREIEQSYINGIWQNSQIVTYMLHVSPDKAKQFLHEFPRLGLDTPAGVNPASIDDSPHTLWAPERAAASKKSPKQPRLFPESTLAADAPATDAPPVAPSSARTR